MTAVTQTPHFAALDESTLKTFIARVAAAGAFKKWALSIPYKIILHFSTVN